MLLKKAISIALATVMTGTLAVASTSAVVTNDNLSGASAYYNSHDNYATYHGNDLGATYSKESTTFKVWAPTASSVKLNLYATGSDNEDGAKSLGVHNMTKDSSNNVWSVTVKGNLNSIYYTYSITNKGTTQETQDVYSLATGVNGKRSMVVDLDSTDPEGWNTDKHVLFNSAQEAVVWEVHVRDFSISDSSGISDENKGKYLAF
ncbi:MAG: hypothetical protein II233_02285, partial [Clostridia bacterium]|nr:hypothetical protein [Clostridia bacterium]